MKKREVQFLWLKIEEILVLKFKKNAKKDNDSLVKLSRPNKFNPIYRTHASFSHKY